MNSFQHIKIIKFIKIVTKRQWGVSKIEPYNRRCAIQGERKLKKDSANEFKDEMIAGGQKNG